MHIENILVTSCYSYKDNSEFLPCPPSLCGHQTTADTIVQLIPITPLGRSASCRPVSQSSRNRPHIDSIPFRCLHLIAAAHAKETNCTPNYSLPPALARLARRRRVAMVASRARHEHAVISAPPPTAQPPCVATHSTNLIFMHNTHTHVRFSFMYILHLSFSLFLSLSLSVCRTLNNHHNNNTLARTKRTSFPDDAEDDGVLEGVRAHIENAASVFVSRSD